MLELTLKLNPSHYKKIVKFLRMFFADYGRLFADFQFFTDLFADIFSQIYRSLKFFFTEKCSQQNLFADLFAEFLADKIP